MALASTFTVDVADVLDMARIMNDGPTIVQREMLWGMEGGVTVLHGDIKDVTPKCRSGKLQESLQKSITQTGKDITGEVKSLGSIAPYNRYVAEGRGPVVAKKGKALKITLCNGTVLFRKRVRGAAANDFMGKGRDRAQPKIFRRFDEVGERIVIQLSRGGR